MPGPGGVAAQDGDADHRVWHGASCSGPPLGPWRDATSLRANRRIEKPRSTRRVELAPVLRLQPEHVLHAFPRRPVRVLVPFPPGGATDGEIRAVCEQATKRFGRSVLVENRPRGGLTLAAQAVVNEPHADG